MAFFIGSFCISSSDNNLNIEEAWPDPIIGNGNVEILSSCLK